MKSFIILFTMLALVAIVAACAKEELIEDPARAFPQEMTVENWEEFVDAPEEVLEKFHQAEMAKVKRSVAEAPNFDASRIVLGTSLLGEVQVQGDGFNPNTTYLGGTLVRVNNGTTTSSFTSFPSPFFSGQNYFITNLVPGTLCFYHQGITNGNYPASEWVNGVSVLDMVRIQRHILGIELFTDLWQYLAADVDGNAQIDSTDINTIRDLILGIRTDLPPLTSGGYNQPVIYFPQGDYDLVQANLTSFAPFINFFYPEVTCKANTADSDRFAIKRGDLSGDWSF
ncbi:MAG: hypothetical protein AAGN35_12730 [Bacteroidota bacterium]